jgi:hypothetical protein
MTERSVKDKTCFIYFQKIFIEICTRTEKSPEVILLFVKNEEEEVECIRV